MKIIKIIYDNIPRICIALLVIYSYFAFGPPFAIIAVLVPVLRIISNIGTDNTYKTRRLSTREFINEIDESGEYHE